jgi:predicted nucleic acid-binding protein
VTIYADTSFLASLLYPPDSNHAKARAWFVPHAGETWLTTAWSQFETINGLRSLCLASRGPSLPTIEAIRQLFKHWHRVGPFEFQRVEWEEAMQDANQISAALAARLKARAADVIHVALLEQLTPDLFVTFDKNQAALATKRGFRSLHLR